jgi:hypothetical protein
VAIVSRRPRGHLGTLIELLWASDAPFAVQDPARRELVLPTGCVHLAIRLAGRSLRLFKGQDDLLGTLVDSAVIKDRTGRIQRRYTAMLSAE